LIAVHGTRAAGLFEELPPLVGYYAQLSQMATPLLVGGNLPSAPTPRDRIFPGRAWRSVQAVRNMERLWSNRRWQP